MRISGKLIGGIVGWILFRHPLGILIGVILGHFYDAARARLAPPLHTASFIGPLFAFAGALAKSDGRVSDREISAAETLMARMRLDAEQRRVAIEQFTRGKLPEFQTATAIAELKAWCAGRRDRAFLLLDLLLELVYADGPLVQAKLELVRKLCWALGVSDRELGMLAAMKGYGFAGGGPWSGASGGRRSNGNAGARSAPAGGPDPYAVLGLPRSAGDREIKGAYRKLMSQHHPDKLGDVPEALKQRAEERAREINTAYDRIKAERGLK